MYCQEMHKIGLEINSMESALYAPQWHNQADASLLTRDDIQLQQLVPQTSEPPQLYYRTFNNELIPIVRQGLKILGGPLGSPQYCAELVQKVIHSIKQDLDLLSAFPHLHQRTKLAVHCSNTRITYLLRSTPLSISLPELPVLDHHFENFVASTMDFQEDYSQSEHAANYSKALQQARLGIRQGGFGLTSAQLTAPAAVYVAFRDFNQWYSSLTDVWDQSSIHHLPWLHTLDPSLAPQAPGPFVFPYIQQHFTHAVNVLSHDWNVTCDLHDHRPQNVITSQMKQALHLQFIANCTHDEAARVAAIGLQSIPTRNPHSQLCPARVPGQDHLDQCPMSLFALMCPFELSNQAFVTCMSICFGVPVPHAQLLQHCQGYSNIDVWADFLLNDSAHASRSRHVSHDRLAFCLSNLAARAGLTSSAIQSSIPVAEADTFRRGDIVTSVAGLSRSSTYRFSSQTQLITDVTLTHPYSRTHVFNPHSLQDAESLKNRSYLEDYNNQGMAFAPLACNSFGQQGPELLRYQWIVADRGAQRAVSLPEFRLPDAAALPGAVDEHSSLLAQYKRRRQSFFRQSTQEVLVTIFEGICERVYGRTFALQDYPEYRDFFRRVAVPWRPTFLPVASAAASPPRSQLSSLRSVSPPGATSVPPSPSLGGPQRGRRRRPHPPLPPASSSSQPSVTRLGRLSRSAARFDPSS